MPDENVVEEVVGTVKDVEVVEEPKEYGIEELKDVIVFSVSVAEALGRTLEDGKFDWQESLHFIKSMTKLPAAIEGISQVELELGDLTDEEKVEIEKLIEELNMPVEKTEVIVEKALAIAVDLTELIAIFKG